MTIGAHSWIFEGEPSAAKPWKAIDRTALRQGRIHVNGCVVTAADAPAAQPGGAMKRSIIGIYVYIYNIFNIINIIYIIIYIYIYVQVYHAFFPNSLQMCTCNMYIHI
jgi:hypothetical protein